MRIPAAWIPVSCQLFFTRLGKRKNFFFHWILLSGSLFFLSTSEITAQYIPVNIPLLKQQIRETKEDSTKLRLYSILGWELRFIDPKESERLADEIIKKGSESKNNLRLAEAYQIKGFARVLEQKLQESLNMYAVAMEYAKKANSGFVQAHLLSLKAGMYQDKGDYDMAIRFYLEGLKVAEDAHSPEMIATLANNLAEAYSDAGRPISFTLPYYQQALKEETAMGNWQYVGMIYSNIAKEQMMAGNKEEAEKAAMLALEMINKKNDRAYVYATVNTDIGEVYTGLGKYAEAEQLLTQGFKILDSIGTKDNKLITLSALARLYLKKHETAKASATAKQLLQLATAYKTKLFLRDAYQVLSGVARIEKKPEQALDYYEQYKNWNDSVFNENKEKSIANVESRLKMQEKELEIRFETSKNAKENLALKEFNQGLQNRSIAILVITILLLVLGIVLTFANRAKTRRNAELEKQKLIIEKQSEEKDTLIREINHRVKNNLQVISSLLNLQAYSLTDEKAIEALRDSHKRVKAISLIHQKLYGNEDTASIVLEEYIRSLFTELKMVYAAREIQLECKTEPAVLRLDIESAVPIGLILNETITNAFKYAFAENTPGTIQIVFTDNGDETYSLSIKDNGQGLPRDFNPDKNASLGMRIIKELSRQLKGSFSFYNDSGAGFRLTFPHTSLRRKTG